MEQLSRIGVIGLGYIGLPTAAMFASQGLEVHGVDVNPTVVEKINRGIPHFGEPNLDALVRRVVEAGKLDASTEVASADAYLIAVPTPITTDNMADLGYVEAAGRAVAKALRPGVLVVLESTSPVGTTEQLCRWMAEERPDLSFPHQKGELSDIRVAYCPERVLPGRILEEVVNNARVIGGMTRKCAQRAMTLYRIVVRGDCQVTDARTAELVKLTENAYRDVNIAFANELSMICEELRINVWEMIRLANLHPRVNVLRPGPGVGGHCIAVDPWFIHQSAPARAQMIRLAREINLAKPHFVVDRVRQRARDLKAPVIACLGLTYKADVDDLRESPALEIVAELARERLGEILVVEPHIAKLPAPLAALGLELSDFDRALERANLVVLLVDHQAFQYVDRDLIKDKFVIDTRGAW
jgi:UDP-N-acetyl-D-mannosaminuronic acid dehydrogenase